VTNTLRVGLVGGGHWARTVHAPVIAAHPHVTFAGVWARRPESAQEVAKEHGTSTYGSVAGLVEDVDVVAFAVPPAAQARYALDAAAAGRHLICEKPLAETLDDARALAEAVERAGVVSSVVLTLRHDPGVLAWLAGFPTEPAGVDTVASARWLSGSLLGGPYATSAWRAEPANGALLDLGPHVVDLLDAAIGPVVTVDWAHRSDPDLWRFGLTHAGGAHSTTMLSLRTPEDPSEIEFATFGGVGTHRFAGRADGRTGYAHLLDELVAAVEGTGPRPATDVARGLRLQELVTEIRRTALTPREPPP
jgi:predicted dehydrogenase